MDISSDHVRREAASIQADHEASLPGMRDALNEVLDDDNGFAPEDRAGLLLGSIGRRRLLQLGGITVATAAVLAACGSDKGSGSAATTAGTTATTAGGGATTTGGTAAAGDVTILRTASSIEELAVAAYQTAIDSGLVKTPAVGDAAKLFQAQHKEHSALFQAATKQAGGEPFTMANPAILAAIKPTIDGLKDEAGVLALALQLEMVAAETYQADVGTFKDPNLNAAIMTVGGVEARHAALLRTVLMQTPVPKAFQVTDMAVKPGTGV